MTTLSKDEIIAMAREAGFMSAEFWPDDFKGLHATVERFAALCRADLVAENERLAVQLSHTQLDCQTEAATVVALRAENERLASLAKEYRDNGDRLLDVADSLRAELASLRAALWGKSGEAV